MGLKVTSIDDLDPELVSQAHAEITQLMQERHPEAELTRGAIHDLIAYFGGVFGAWEQDELQSYLDARSLLAIETDPDLADPELADHVFSNYNVTRKTGDYATGNVTIIVAELTSYVIPNGFQFFANGLTFATTEAWTARPPEMSLTGVNDRHLNPLGNDTYSFSVPVTCQSKGTVGNVPRNTKMVPPAIPQHFVTAYATDDFVGGVFDEVNEDVLRRLQEGIAAKTISSSTNIRALIKEQDEFLETLDYSIVGYGNPEMMRDQHWIFPVSGGGRIDVYSRTRALPEERVLAKEAVLVDVIADGGVWQFSLNRSEAPGFYEVVQIILPDDPPETGGFTVILDQRAFDMSPTGTLLPDILTLEESAYTRHQTSVIRFVDTITPTADLEVGVSRKQYQVAVSVMPYIAELQDFLAGHAVRYRAGDVLVKAAVPCFLTVNFDIRQAVGSAAPDLEAIKNELATRVNKLGFPGQLHASLLADIVHNSLRDRQALSPIQMHGRIRRPSGELHYIRDTGILQIPDDPGNLVTGRTTAFILDTRNIGISVVTEGFTVDT